MALAALPSRPRLEASDPESLKLNVEICAIWQDEDILYSLSRILLKNTK